MIRNGTGSAFMGKLAAELERRLGEKASATVANVIPLSVDGGPDDDPDNDVLTRLKQDIAKARGRSVFVETTAAGYGEGMNAVPRQDW